MEPDTTNNNGESAMVPTVQAVEVVEVTEIKALQWEPVTTEDCFRRCQTLVKSGLFRKFQNPEQAYVVALKGREMGLTFMQSTAMFDVIQGQIALKAQAQIALIERQGVAEYITCEVMTEDRAVWVTKRKGRPKEQRVEFTLAMAEKRGYLSKDNWRRMPETMLMWRAGSMLARMAYSDIVMGLYDPDELRDEADLDPFGASLQAGGTEAAITAASAALGAPTAHAAPKAKSAALLDQLKGGVAPKPTPPKLVEAEAPPPKGVRLLNDLGLLTGRLVEPVKDEPPPVVEKEPPPPVEEEPPPVEEEPPPPTEEPPPVEEEAPKTEEERKQSGRDTLKRIQKELAALVGMELARTAWYAEGGPEGIAKLRNLAIIETKVGKARALWRKFELAELIGGHAANVKELGPPTDMPDIDTPWTKSLDELSTMEDVWRSQAEMLGAEDPGDPEEAFGPPSEEG